jgi:hypothetical protein
MERRCCQRRGCLEQHVGVVLVFTAQWCRGVVVAPATGGGARKDCGVELASDGSPCPSGPSVDALPYGAQRDGHSRAAKICTPPD